MKWEWWIWCRKCNHWAKGYTENFHGWACPKCASYNIKGGINFVESEEWV